MDKSSAICHANAALLEIMGMPCCLVIESRMCSVRKLVHEVNTASHFHKSCLANIVVIGYAILSTSMGLVVLLVE